MSSHICILTKQATHSPESKLLLRNEQSRTIAKANNLVYMCFAMMYFLSHGQNNSLQAAFPFLSNSVGVKIQFKENPKISRARKEATKQHKNDVTDGHKDKAKSPKKILERQPICSLHKKPHYFWLQMCQNKIMVRSLILQECNNTHEFI